MQVFLLCSSVILSCAQLPVFLPSCKSCKSCQNFSSMPEFPDITVYLEALEARIIDHTLECVQIASPFLLRTATPPVSSIEGKQVVQLRRLGKRICFGFEDELWLVLHLMIAGRLHWKDS